MGVWYTGRMFARQKKNRYQVSVVVVLIAAILSLAFGYAMGMSGRIAVALPAVPAAPSVPEAAEDGIAYAPTDRWKHWRDEDMTKGRSGYVGYEMKYPRDFDVRRGEDAGGGWIGLPRVRVSFPEDAFADPPTNFRTASVLVSIADDATEDECYVDPAAGAVDRERIAAVHDINGAKFRAVTLRDAAAGSRYDTELYRTWHAGRCVEIALNLGMSNIANYDPGAVRPFEPDRAWSVLHAIRDTFRFTDPPPPIEPAVIAPTAR